MVDHIDMSSLNLIDSQATLGSFRPPPDAPIFNFNWFFKSNVKPYPGRLGP